MTTSSSSTRGAISDLVSLSLPTLVHPQLRGARDRPLRERVQWRLVSLGFKRFCKAMGVRVEVGATKWKMKI
jgi:hypothetical protein